MRWSAQCNRVICLTGLLAQPMWGRSPASDVIAINVLLELDAATVQSAQTINAKLRHVYPKGFSLDATHIPHITLLQCYVHSIDLPKIEEAVRQAVKSQSLQTMRLQTKSYNASSAGLEGAQAALLEIELTSQLQSFHEKIVQAAHPWVLPVGQATAFVPNEDGLPINPQIIRYVEKFIPQSSGPRYQPHITLGLAPPALIRQLKAEPFNQFSLQPTGAAIYQIGDFGTARKKLGL